MNFDHKSTLQEFFDCDTHHHSFFMQVISEIFAIMITVNSSVNSME